MTDLTPLFRFTTYPAAALRAVAGANEGDAIGLGEAALPGDIYRLRRQATPRRLAICDLDSGRQVVADGSDVARPGAGLAIVDCHTLMGPRGEVIEILMLRCEDVGEDAGEGDGGLHLLPLATLAPGVDYELIGSAPEVAPERFADIASVSFLKGTHLTLATGAQKRVEELAVGDRLLTRDHGPQPIRWIGRQTRRAVGAAAPVRIVAGTLNTARDLCLTPQHRLFIWQRRDAMGTGRAELMVRADLLVNGSTVTREEGGHVDSYQLVFDGHEIIYAEGIAVESLLVTAETRARLPAGLGLGDAVAGQRSAREIELDERDVRGAADVADRLTRASRGIEE
jgi:hypothetical protein